MTDEKLSMSELKNKALSFDRAEMWDLLGKKEDKQYLCKKHMLVWNIDKGEKACIAPKNYSVIQHKTAVESIVDAITSLNIKSEAELKTSRHGVHIDIDFPDSKMELNEVGESFTSGIRIVNDYSITLGLQVAPRLTRLACTNGMVVTDIVKTQRIKYTEQLQLTVEGIIDKMIKDIIASDDKLANMVSICMKDSVEWQTATLLAKEFFKKKKHIKEILSRVKFDEQRRITRWSFYNAITHYATHGERLRPNIQYWLQNKAQSVLKTPFENLTEQLVKIEEKQGD